MRIFHRISTSITPYFTPGLHLVIAPAPADACLKSPTRRPVPITVSNKPQGLDGIIGSRGGDLPTRPPSPTLQFRSHLGKKQEPASLVTMWLLLHSSFRIPRMTKSLIYKDI